MRDAPLVRDDPQSLPPVISFIHNCLEFWKVACDVGLFWIERLRLRSVPDHGLR